MQQDQKNTKPEIFVAIATCKVPSPLSIILKIFLKCLTGKQFQTVVVQNCYRSASVNQKQEKSHCGPTEK